jgi:hypothetical protein
MINMGYDAKISYMRGVHLLNCVVREDKRISPEGKEIPRPLPCPDAFW